MVDINQFFNLSDFFINDVFGSAELAVIFGIIAVAFFALKRRIPDKVALGLIGLFCAIAFAISGLQIIWIFLILTIAGGIYLAIEKLVNR